jgi:photosystem II stability/assembly factor-like uncharacterized protein
MNARAFRYVMLAAMFAATTVAQVARAEVSPSLYAGMHWRTIGPLRGGRTVAATGSPDNPNLFYIAAVNGGIWKSDDAGRTWRPIFDGQPTGSIGALAVAWSDPKTIYAGSGEGLQRPDLAVGDGIYKSTDGGTTWKNVGLRDGQQIGSIAVDPHDPGRVYVAVLGHPYGPNDQRGIYRTVDGGTTWERVLFENADTGAFDVTIDPNDAHTVYATLWAARQAPWEVGGSFEIAGSGVYKSSDGGTTWNALADGLPARIGRSEVAVAPSNSRIVYVYADTEKDGGAVYRSEDAGAHFTKGSDAANVAERGDDLISLAVDPTDPNTVYLTNTTTYRSTDGGKTFVPIKGAPGGDDYHTVWINPTNRNVIILASDQGAVVSVNGGRSWSSWYNQPTAQMYHVAADDRFPYWVCGGQQESGSACVSSRGPWGETTMRDWETVGAEEYGYVVPDPLHAGVFFGGKVERFDEHTGQTQEVSPNPLRGKGYRVVRTEPLAFDRFDKHLLYFGSNVVWTTRDAGSRWAAISPDLTRADPAVPPVIGSFEADDPQHGKHRGVVYALAPSYRHAGTIWAGTDDGLVWITRDAGAHWANITPPQLTPWSKVSQIEASRVDDDTAFVAVNRFRLDDLHPYVYITHDGGAHWKLSVSGLPVQPVNAVRQDPVAPNLLYAATENGVAVSFDTGATWQSLQLNLPRTSVRDLIVHGDDVAIATHGRGFWILDDVEPLRQLTRSTPLGNVHLFTPAMAFRVRRSTNTDTPLPPEEPTGQNPPDGAIVDYALAAPAKRVVISFLDGRGNVMRRYSSDDPAPGPIPDLDKPAYWERPFHPVPTSAGMHRFVWNLREPDPRSNVVDLPISAVPGDTPRVPEGPLVMPGTYIVQLDVDGTIVRRGVHVVMDPRVSTTYAQLLQQYALAHAIAAAMDRSFDRAAAATTAGKHEVAQGFEGVNAALGALLDVVDGADAPPTAAAVAAFARLRDAVAAGGLPPDMAGAGKDEP